MRSNKGLFANEALYRLPKAAKIIYRSKGVLFWFDERDRASQSIVFKPS